MQVVQYFITLVHLKPFLYTNDWHNYFDCKTIFDYALGQG